MVWKMIRKVVRGGAIIFGMVLSMQVVLAEETDLEESLPDNTVLQQMFAVPQEQSGITLTENGVILKKVLPDGLVIVTLIPEEVPRANGPGILDVFYAEGWKQLTTTDRVSNAQPDVICDLAANDQQVIVGCKINGAVEINGKVVYLPKSSATVSVPGFDAENRLSKSYAFFDQQIVDAVDGQVTDVLVASTARIDKEQRLSSAE